MEFTTYNYANSSDPVTKWPTKQFTPPSVPNVNLTFLDSNETLWENVHNVTGSNVTGSNVSTRTTKDVEKTVHDIEYDYSIRIAILYVQIIVGILGAILLFSYMLHARRLVFSFMRFHVQTQEKGKRGGEVRITPRK